MRWATARTGRGIPVAAAGVAAEARCDRVGSDRGEFSGVVAAAAFSAEDLRAGAAERNRFGRSGLWRIATIHALALSFALPSCRPHDLPIARHGRRSAAELGIGEEQIAVLPNPVDLEGIRAASNAPRQWNGAGPHLLAAGRLSAEKGFDLLLEALAIVRERFPEADLIIAGGGAGGNGAQVVVPLARIGGRSPLCRPGRFSLRPFPRSHALCALVAL